MIRKLFITAAVIVAALIFCACAYADAALYIGSRNAGAVKTLENNSGLFVSVEDVGKLMGFSSSRTGEELWLQRGNVQLRVVDNSAAAWYGFSIVPLYSAPFKQDGKTWLDSSSAAALFQRVLGSGQNNRLRISKIAGYTVTAANARNDIDFGNFESPTPSAPSQTPTPTTAKNPEPVINLPEVRTAAKTPEPQLQTAAATQNSSIKKSASKAKAQPKLETFKLSDSKGDKSETYSGVIQGIRWTSHEGTQKKIRAVVLVDDDAEPTVFMNRRQLHALFSSSLETPEQLASPFGNVKTEFKKNARGIDLVFDFDKLSKAEKIVLTNPKRIVFDFFLPGSVTITKSVTAKEKVQQATQPKPTLPTVQPTPAPVINQKKEDKEPPAKTLILIPTSPTPTPSRNSMRVSGRKTIVVDPGHGGKDPGASDNGVVEKNVNLAIGLELEKALQARGYNVIMTRRTDVYLKLQERTDIANNANADLFVSVHVNALPSKKDMTGFEIYIMALPTDKDAMNLAKIENREYVEGKGFDTANVDRRTEMLLRILGDMQQNNKISESTEFAAALYNAGVRNSLPMRRVAQAPFFVLRGAGMPAVLLETGFVTNATESKRLTTQAYQQKIAGAMAEGIVNYIR